MEWIPPSTLQHATRYFISHHNIYFVHYLPCKHLLLNLPFTGAHLFKAILDCPARKRDAAAKAAATTVDFNAE